MSERLTQEWTPTAAEAFGASGTLGDEGEEFLSEVLKSWGWTCELHSSSFSHQVRGVDVTFRKPSWSNSYTADIKTNHDEYGNFFVETDDDGWLFNPKKDSDRIWHVNKDTGWMAWYNRNEMKAYIESNQLRNTGLCKLTMKDDLPFVTRRRHRAR